MNYTSVLLQHCISSSRRGWLARVSLLNSSDGVNSIFHVLEIHNVYVTAVALRASRYLTDRNGTISNRRRALPHRAPVLSHTRLRAQSSHLGGWLVGLISVLYGLLNHANRGLH